MMSVWRGLGVLLALAISLSFGLVPAQAQKTKLTIYTALENDQLAPFKAAIEAAVPDVEVVWVRDSTGVITARFLAEKDNPRADMGDEDDQQVGEHEQQEEPERRKLGRGRLTRQDEAHDQRHRGR